MKEIDIVKKSENYSIGDIGEFKDLKEYFYFHKAANMNIPGKVFLGESLNMTSMEISFQVLNAGKEIPFDHKHKTHEEVYIVLKGCGQFIVDGEVTHIKEGSVVRAAPQANRRWKNNSKDDLVMMVIQAVNGTLKNYNVTDGYSKEQ